MNLYVREYCWMWSDLHLSLAECRVYAYIYGLTHGDKGGFDGSKRGLAKSLGLSEASVRNILDTLTEKSLISYTNGLWQSVSKAAEDSAQSVRSSAQPLRESAQSVRENAQPLRSPHTPLYNNINNKNKASMQTDFDKFWLWFSPSPEFQNRKAATQMLFEARSDVARDSILEAARDGINSCGDRNPYFFVQDFPEPQPQFLRGDEGGDIVQVKYNGAFKLCSRATMELFGLQWVRDW